MPVTGTTALRGNTVKAGVNNKRETVTGNSGKVVCGGNR